MDFLDSGGWVDHAGKSSAAQALALKEIAESRAFEQLELTRQESFGEAWFRLAQIARISP